MKDFEKRELNFGKMQIETREEDTGKRYVRGKIPYNSLSSNLGGFREKIMPGAFTKSLKEGSIPVLWNHEHRYVCGRNTAGTAVFNDTETGLEFEAELPNTTWASDMWESISRGDVRGVSFGFYVIKDTWSDQDKPIQTRELNEVQLFEVSAGVTFPAYPKSRCDARNSAEDTEKAFICMNEEERNQIFAVLAEIKEELKEIRSSKVETVVPVAESTVEPQPEPVAECAEEERKVDTEELEAREALLSQLENYK